MESIGAKLKQTREEKGYSVEQVGRDTNIARHYIEALEEENFTVFPGDPYLIGFLRNYAEYLGLDGQELVGLYHNLKIQEQPVPMEELLNRKKKIPFIPLLLGILVLAVIGGVVYFFAFSGIPASRPQEQVSETAPADGQGELFAFASDEEILERRFLLGDQVTVSLDSGDITLLVDALGETVRLIVPSGPLEIAPGEGVLADLDGDGEGDLLVSVQDIRISEESAVIRFDRFLKRPAHGGDGMEETDSSSALGTTTVASREREVVTIISANQPEPFQVEIRFRGYALFRYLADGSRREERYFRNDELFRMDIDREIRLWISNAGAVTVRIAGSELNLGPAGAVFAGLVRWERSGSGEYELKLVPVY
jgi:cytoskeleton protein RodZ